MSGTELALAIVLAIFGSTGFFALIQFLITRYDKKKGGQKKIEDKLDEIDRGLVRTQLLLLIFNEPVKREEEIFELARQYFVDMNGNHYTKGVFRAWLKDRDLPKPDWFKE